MIISKVFRDTARGERLFAGYDMLKLAPNGRQHFFTTQMDGWLEDGTVSIKGDKLTFHTVNGDDVVFTIDHPPGTFCCHCLEQIKVPAAEANLPAGHADKGKAARAHVDDNHKGETSPNDSYLAGYKVKNYYGATVEAS